MLSFMLEKGYVQVLQLNVLKRKLQDFHAKCQNREPIISNDN